MNACKPGIKLASILLGLLIALPLPALADKGGKPNKKSVATTAACITADGDAHVYSCKGLSNVVLWCGTMYVKHDDIGDENGSEIYEGVFGCPEADGVAIDQEISFISVKSGSQKHAKHNDDYESPAGLPDNPPSGSGLFVGEIPFCADLAPDAIPTPGICDVEPEEPPLF